MIAWLSHKQRIEAARKSEALQRRVTTLEARVAELGRGESAIWEMLAALDGAGENFTSLAKISLHLRASVKHRETLLKATERLKAKAGD